MTNLLKYIQNVAGGSKSRRLLGGTDMFGSRRTSGSRGRRKSSVRGIIKRTCSIQVDQQEGKLKFISLFVSMILAKNNVRISFYSIVWRRFLLILFIIWKIDSIISFKGWRFSLKSNYLLFMCPFASFTFTGSYYAENVCAFIAMINNYLLAMICKIFSPGRVLCLRNSYSAIFGAVHIFNTVRVRSHWALAIALQKINSLAIGMVAKAMGTLPIPYWNSKRKSVIFHTFFASLSLRAQCERNLKWNALDSYAFFSVSNY